MPPRRAIANGRRERPVAERTAIAWTDATFNPWIGCTEVSPGCDNCYAKALDHRHKWGGDTHWGAGKPRMRTSAENWRKPLRWNRLAEKGLLPDGKTPTHGRRPRVFCASLADVLDNEAPDEWRRDLWDLIELTPQLDWLLLTKRIGNAARLLRTHDWCAGQRNVWLGATIVNQEEAERDVPKLLATPARLHFVSYEPALGPVDWTRFPGIDWIIVGGESTNAARPFRYEWARSTIAQCREIGAAPFMKQTGTDLALLYERVQKDRNGADPAEWPEDLRVQEFPK